MRETMSKIFFRLSFLLFCVGGCVMNADASYIMSIHLDSYVNVNNSLADGTCCGCCVQEGMCVAPCNDSLHFCLQFVDQGVNDTMCPIRQFTGSAERRGITISVDQPWLGALQLLVTASTDPEDELIDRVLLPDIPLSPFEDLTSPMSIVGEFGRVTLDLRFQVSCSDNYFGLDCFTFCVPVNDSSGHYECKEDGSIECLDGFQNVQSNCTECIPADGCSPVGGFCREPMQCICYPGYSGISCTSLDTSIRTLPQTSISAYVFETQNVSTVVTEHMQLQTSMMQSTHVLPTVSINRTLVQISPDMLTVEPTQPKSTLRQTTHSQTQIGMTVMLSRTPVNSSLQASPTPPDTLGVDSSNDDENNWILLIVGVSLGVLVSLVLVIVLITVICFAIRKRRSGKFHISHRGRFSKHIYKTYSKSRELSSVTGGSDDLQGSQAPDIITNIYAEEVPSPEQPVSTGRCTLPHPTVTTFQVVDTHPRNNGYEAVRGSDHNPYRGTLPAVDSNDDCDQCSIIVNPTAMAVDSQQRPEATHYDEEQTSEAEEYSSLDEKIAETKFNGVEVSPGDAGFLEEEEDKD